MPQDPTTSRDVAVVGGGVIGLAVAWRAAQRGLAVACSSAASSARAPRTSRPGCSRRSPRPTPASATLLALGLRSARAWPAFAAELEASPAPTSATARAARCSSPATATRPRRSSASARCASASGLAVERLLPSAARRARARAGAVAAARARRPRRPRGRPARAVSRSPRRRGAPASRCARARSSTRRRSRPPRSGVRLAGGDVRAARVVVAAGAWSRRARGPPASRAAGQGPGPAPARPGGRRPAASASLRWRRRLPRPARRRALLPRRDDGGARLRHRGHRAGGVHELLRDAAELVPGVARARDRGDARPACGPATPDNAPLIGTVAEPRDCVWATGHSPQRRPARAGDRRARRRRARARRRRRADRRRSRPERFGEEPA